MDDAGTMPTFREVMAAFPTGVTIVAARDADGEPYGLTVSSFTSVSLDPALVLVCIGHGSTSHERLSTTSSFAVSILSGTQGDTALRFATEPSLGRFEEIEWSPSPSGSPVLADSVAWLDCELKEVLRGGDHSILLGRVVTCGTSDRPALVFHRGRMSSTD